MKLQLQKPAKSLNKAYFKQSLKREQIELFKKELKKTFNYIDENQDEEYHKNVISDFFKEVYCKDKYLINVNKRQDLVIRLGNKPADSIGVILEFKKPPKGGSKNSEMVSENDWNVKSFHELVLYYLNETRAKDQHKITHLIVTNIFEWYIFDEVWFEKYIFRNTQLKKDYENWKISGHDTRHFYELIVAKHLDNIHETVPCTYFNLNDYENIIIKGNEKDDKKLIDLYKILSPENLLKKPFINDSNTLDKDFYNELLHILGLEEKAGAKKVIERKEPNLRDEGSLLENTITVLKRQNRFGYNDDEETERKYFDLALELCITWLDRILFLKLLEGQLIKYHKGDKQKSFLNIKTVKDYDELDELFFEVLAVPYDKRTLSVKEKYGIIPYLNSSLFEPSHYELKYQGINQLKDRLDMPVYNHTVLKETNGKRISGRKLTLHYLFDFLESYDFASDSSAEIQEENKTIINASVLGLIFEKINGYKDGSFFTPGFITMYMCRESIRKVVLMKFNAVNKEWNCKTFEELKDKIDYSDKLKRKEANDIINTIKICDPAVGSGHFLVSALNELIALKSDLHVLSYRNGLRLKGFKIVIANDELIITNEEDDQLFNYSLNTNNKSITELQELQETLFHEKQTLIEKCLFGVDINPKSVLICRLRLWIELLKNSYYTKESDYEYLETLPNIDINIKCGNTLINRFAITDDVFENIPNFIKKLNDYKTWVNDYKETNDKKLRDQLNTQIEKFKFEFKKRDRKLVSLDKDITKASDEMIMKYKSNGLFVADLTEKQLNHKKGLEEKLEKLHAKRSDLLNDNIYQNSFEWRFEFPEVLGINGEFIGFDLVIGNPPYIGEKDNSELFKKYKSVDKWKNVLTKRTNLYYSFILFCNEALSQNGFCHLIIPNELLTSDYASHVRNEIALTFNVYSIFDFNKLQVFRGVGTNAMLFSFGKNITTKEIIYRKYENNQDLLNVNNSKFNEINFKNDYLKNNTYWNFIKDKVSLENAATIDYYGLTTQQGVITGCNSATGKLYNKLIKYAPNLKISHGLGIFVLQEDQTIRHQKNDVYINNTSNPNEPNWKKLTKYEQNFIKPLYSGNKIKKYEIEETDNYLIWLTKENINEINHAKIKNIIEHLEHFKSFLINRNTIINFVSLDKFDSTLAKGVFYNGDGDTQASLGQGNYLVLQKYAYGLDFNEPKLMWQSRGEVNFFLSEKAHYALSSVNYIYFKNKVPSYLKAFSKIEILAFISGILNSTLYQKFYNGNNNTGTKIKALKIFKIDPKNNEHVLIAKSIAQNVIQCIKNYEARAIGLSALKKVEKEINNLVSQLYHSK